MYEEAGGEVQKVEEKEEVQKRSEKCDSHRLADSTTFSPVSRCANQHSRPELWKEKENNNKKKPNSVDAPEQQKEKLISPSQMLLTVGSIMFGLLFCVR